MVSKCLPRSGNVVSLVGLIYLYLLCREGFTGIFKPHQKMITSSVPRVPSVGWIVRFITQGVAATLAAARVSVSS